MSDHHCEIARPIILRGSVKVVLMILASRACRYCGLCWPGMRTLQEETGLGSTRLRESLDELVAAGLVEIHAYPRGGRGRATEWVILPRHMAMDAAPCGKCRSNMSKPSPRGGYDKDGTQKPLATRGVLHKPTVSERKTHRTGVDQLEVEHQLSAPSAPADPPASPPGPSDPPPPRNATEALQRVAEMIRGIGAAPLQVPRTVKPDPSSDETAR